MNHSHLISKVCATLLKAPLPLATSPKEMVPVMPLDLSRSGCDGAEAGGVNLHGAGDAFRTCDRNCLRFRLESLGAGVIALLL
jgi:hypothetical protein